MISLSSNQIAQICENFANAHPLVTAFRAGYNLDQSDYTNAHTYPLLFLKLPVMFSYEAGNYQQATYRNATFQLQCLDIPEPDLSRQDLDTLLIFDKTRLILEDFIALWAAAEAWQLNASLVSAQIDAVTEIANMDKAIASDLLITARTLAPDFNCSRLEGGESLIDLSACV